MSSTSKRQTSVRDSIVSLFKRSNRNGKKSGGAEGVSGSSESYNAGQNISTPQNVKRVMHITFNASSQGFDGIPEHWRQYFESQPDSAGTDQASSSTAPAAAASAEAATRNISVIQEEPAAEENAMLIDLTSEEASSRGQSLVDTAEPSSRQRADEEIIDETECDRPPPLPPPPPPPPRQPRELLSLAYDRSVGQFVNLPQHWEDRLKRNNLLAPEFNANPHLLTLVFSMMDEELRAMRAEGARVESCLYSSPSTQRRSAASDSSSIDPSRAPDSQLTPPYVFEIEADKSNSSSELDLMDDEHGEKDLKNHRHSLVTVRAVEVPEDIVCTQF